MTLRPRGRGAPSLGQDLAISVVSRATSSSQPSACLCAAGMTRHQALLTKHCQPGWAEVAKARVQLGFPLAG